MGSVKDFKIIEDPTPDKLGKGRFIYSDRYSVFDWGEMPDLIDNKGAATALLGAYFFEKLEEMGIPTHYEGLVEGRKVKRLSEISNSSDVMEVKLLRIIKPLLEGNHYDYSIYYNELGCFLIPLEIIYRNYLPPGSSVFRRLERGELKPQDLGLDKPPEPNQKLEEPLLDVSTKLEITDRYIPWEEAQEISGLDDQEVERLKEIATTVNDLITKEYAAIGLVNEDGKIEAGFDQHRRIMLVDVLGTLDECRFTYEGLPVSKEILRIYYRNTPWYSAVEEAKEKDRQNWKEICTLEPEELPYQLKKMVSQVYCACTNEITGEEWFKGLPPLKEIMGNIKEFLKV